MILSICSLLLFVSVSTGDYVFGAPPIGLIHDMRTFVNVTFDWSCREYCTQHDTAIPQCHEKRIRRTYYELSAPAISWMRTRDEFEMKGHLVYPLVISVNNGTDSEQNEQYFAAGVHETFGAGEDTGSAHSSGAMVAGKWYSLIQGDIEIHKVIDLIIVSEKTWKLIWNHWISAIEQGLTLCDGGSYFFNILPRIHEDAKLKPQYDDIVQTYTDITSDVCSASNCDQALLNHRETLTLAYPTEEGLRHLLVSPFFDDVLPRDNASILRAARKHSDSDARDFILERHYDGGFNDFLDRNLPPSLNIPSSKSARNKYMRRNRCIFYPPYC